jgi:hypothetical protein
VSRDIELEIGTGSRAGNYVVRVIHATAGAEPTGTLELDVAKTLSTRHLLEAIVLASAGGSVPTAEQSVREAGQRLFEALFTGPVNSTYRSSQGAAKQLGEPLRVVLRLTAPELAALPWEMLFDPETETHLCLQGPLVRHVQAPHPEPLEVRQPLRILGLIASPQGLPALDVDAEKRHLAEALAEPLGDGLVEVMWIEEATWARVQARLQDGQWHVLHFVGHGDHDPRTDGGRLALVSRDGRADMIEAHRLAALLGQAQPAPRLVVLNACSSGQTGAEGIFSGTAAALVRSGVSAVSAMQFAISDTAATSFARGFYTAIAKGKSVDEAARSGRISILENPGSLEWVTPVLYVRGKAAQLFTMREPLADDRVTLERGQLPDTCTSAVLAKDGADGPAAPAGHDNILPNHPAEPLLRINYGSVVDAVSWHPDGRRIAVVAGGQARIYDIPAREEPVQLELTHGNWFSSTQNVVFSLDGTELASGRTDGTVQVWDTFNGQELFEVRHDEAVTSVAFNRDSTQLATGSEDKSTRVWDTAGEHKLFDIGHDDAVTSVAFSPDGTRLATGSRDKTARIWDVTGKEKLFEVPHHKAVTSVAFSPDGTLLATGGEDKTVQVWNVTSEEKLFEVRHGKAVTSVAFSPDGTLLVTGGEDKTARVWNVTGEEKLLELRHDDTVTSVAFSRDGTLLATGSRDKSVRLWSIC